MSGLDWIAFAAVSKLVREPVLEFAVLLIEVVPDLCLLGRYKEMAIR